ncbi:MAG: type II toxin-antitoxin system RelE/ParE family toxin [Chitinophagales bacterium]
MIVKFNNDYLEKIYQNKETRKKPLYNEEVVIQFKKKVQILKLIESTQELKKFKSLRFKPLKGERKGLFSIRVNQAYRLEFKIINEQTIEIIIIEELSNHYGD